MAGRGRAQRMPWDESPHGIRVTDRDYSLSSIMLYTSSLTGLAG